MPEAPEGHQVLDVEVIDDAAATVADQVTPRWRAWMAHRFPHAEPAGAAAVD
jgi:hypothetical protein